MESTGTIGPQDDLEKIKNSDITSIWFVFISSIRKNYIFSIILPAFFLLLATYSSVKEKDANIIFFYIIILLIIFGFVWQNATAKFLKHFASDIGYLYEDRGVMSSVEATLFNLGKSKNISRIILGKYFGRETRLFVFSTEIGSGKNKHTENYSVLEITFNTILPNILLKNRNAFSSSSYMFLDNEKKLSLEGDFSKHFSLYVAKEYELEAMQIFTPDIMQMFIDKGSDLSVEIYNNRAYIYYQKGITKKDQLVYIYGLAKEIILELGPTFERMKDDVEHMSKYAKLT